MEDVNDLASQLVEAENRVAQLKLKIQQSDCLVHGHDWIPYGGSNAGCDLGSSCSCSVPVNVCSKCKDCDYGDNEEAKMILERCKASDL